MYDLAMLDTSCTGTGDQNDGWDSSLDLLWEIEQQAELLPITVPANSSYQLPDPVATVAQPTTEDKTDHSSEQRRLATRKLAQRRCRQRAKERSASAMTELDRLRSQLQQSQSCQAALEAEVQRLQMQQHSALTESTSMQLPAPVQGNAVEVPATLPPNVEALLQSPLKLERPNDTAVVTADSASQSTLHTEQNWKGLYKSAVCRIQERLFGCQSEAVDTADSTPDQLKHLIAQACSSVLSQLRDDLPSLTDTHRTGLNDKPLVPEASGDNGFSILAALEYTDAQVVDLLVLKQLFLTKLGGLSRARVATLSVLTQDLDAGKFRKSRERTEQLQALVADTYQTYLDFGVALTLGIHTSRQAAVGMVYSYPRLFGFDTLMLLEQSRQAPSQKHVKEVAAAAAAQLTWADVTRYLQAVTSETVDCHLPLWSSHMGTS